MIDVDRLNQKSAPRMPDRLATLTLESPLGAAFQLIPRRCGVDCWVFSNRGVRGSIPFMASGMTFFGIAIYAHFFLGSSRSIPVELTLIFFSFISFVIAAIRYGSYDKIMIDHVESKCHILQSRRWKRRAFSVDVSDITAGYCKVIALANINRQRNGFFLKAGEFIMLLASSRNQRTVEDYSRSLPVDLTVTNGEQADYPTIYVRGYSFF